MKTLVNTLAAIFVLGLVTAGFMIHVPEADNGTWLYTLQLICTRQLVITGVIAMLAIIAICGFVSASQKSRHELKFYSPLLIIGVIVLALTALLNILFLIDGTVKAEGYLLLNSTGVGFSLIVLATLLVAKKGEKSSKNYWTSSAMKSIVITVFLLAPSFSSAQYKFAPNLEVVGNPVRMLANISLERAYDIQFRSLLFRADNLPSFGVSGFLADHSESSIMLEVCHPLGLKDSLVSFIGGVEFGKLDYRGVTYGHMSLDLGIRVLVMDVLTAGLQARIPLVGDGGGEKFRFTLGYTWGKF